MNYNEYDELIGSFYGILSSNSSFNTKTSEIFDKLKDLSGLYRRAELQGFFIDLSESHERKNDTRKNITRTYCMLSGCVMRAEHLDYGECFLPLDKIRLSTTKGNLAMMFTVARAKFYDRFKQEINTTLKKSKVFDEYFEKNSNATRRSTQEQYSKENYKAQSKRTPKANTRTGLSASERHRLIEALDYWAFSDALDGDNNSGEKE